MTVPFSIAASFPSGTYGFLRALLAKDQTKRFALDPRSALFQQGWSRVNTREPHRKMAAIFGEPFTTVGLQRPLAANDFSKVAIDSVTKACLQYQLDFRVLEEQQRKLAKYRKLLGIDTIPKIANPQLLVPPYFRFGSINDPWYEICMRSNEYAASIVPADQLCPILHFGAWPNAPDWQIVARSLQQVGVKSLFVYPNNFKEHEATESELSCYTDGIIALAAAEMTTTALHGGYFAILLEKKGLFGFGNGVGYGEWRDSGYHRGGTAEIRLYIPKLHRFLDTASAQVLIDKNPEHFTSNSDLLSEYALASKPLTLVSLQEALDHFMESRQQEINSVRDNPLSVLVTELRETVNVLKAIGQLETERYGQSLIRWSNVLSKQ